MGGCCSTEPLTNIAENLPETRSTAQCKNLASSEEEKESPAAFEDHKICKQDRTDFCWDPIQNCFGSSSGIFSGSKQTLNGYDINALARSSLVGLVQTVKDHITKPTAMARGRVAHLIEWKGWSAQQRGWNRSLTDEDYYSDLTDELKEARFAAGVAEQFAVTEATLSAWSSLDTEEVVDGTSPSVTDNPFDTEEIVPQDHPLSGSQGLYCLNVEGSSAEHATPGLSCPASLAEEPSQGKAFSPLHSSQEASVTGSLLTHEPPNFLSLPDANVCGLALNRTLGQSTDSYQQRSHSYNSMSGIEDDVFYN
ncbi:protein FAM131C isoform X2 [Callorhinchus milii]|uniref:protein FAM131C isoform X2 n=1 Tax=Callorhinchus milii TaxID=7868 RepID=UPI00045716FE|nr:protein FAM131C isoform X2 [Callorhinchus milii]|eukprot:gi/632977100/ref/XP_007905157.1/ PREDICTED: protein FAM131C [Callorhinchus milii]